MRLFTKLLMLTLAVSLAAGCERSANRAAVTAESAVADSASRGESGTAQHVAPAVAMESAGYNNISAADGDGKSVDAAATTVLPERKIIRNAELTIELDALDEAQRKLTSIAESHGGFVVTSESRQRDAGGGQPAAATVEMRVPAPRFDAAVSQIRALGGSVRQEKTTGRDVTEEYIDLEARLRAQRALEAQFLEIMKRAQKVSDALEVQGELATVRGEIERVEGRRRFLENQSALSTIKVTLQSPQPLVSAETSGFVGGIRDAFGEGLDVAAGIVLGLVRVGVALVPVLLIFGVPLALVWRAVRRRYPRRAPTAGTAQPAG